MMLVMMLAAGTGCFATSRDVPAGASLSARDVTAAPCRTDAARARLRYDRDGGVVVAAAALPAGTYLGRLAPLMEAFVAKGAVLTLRSSAGPVTVERQVTAMQAGRAGGRVFVRDSSGKVFAAPLLVEMAP